jgi:hypothetical protein
VIDSSDTEMSQMSILKPDTDIEDLYHKYYVYAEAAYAAVVKANPKF